jgi:hypothetical protein
MTRKFESERRCVPRSDEKKNGNCDNLGWEQSGECK